MSDAVYFRAGVGLLVINDSGLVLAGHRADMTGAWQAPQGGLRPPNEQPIEAAYRELREETGFEQSDVTILGECGPWLGYELPTASRSLKTGRGQVAKWFLLRYKGQADMPGDGGAPIRSEEFDRWEWIPMSELVQGAWAPRQPTYRFLGEYWSDELGVSPAPD
jgi:putative (di)nucleoside polyphosphate hydrolase